MPSYSLAKRKVSPDVVARELRQDPGLRAFLTDLQQFPLLSHADELRLGAQARSTDAVVADAARQTLITSNLRLVVTIAKKYAGQGVPLADLIHEGTLGLMNGVDHYKPHVETRFATYAGWWIEQACKHALEQRSVVRVPYYLDDTRLKVRRFVTAYEMAHGTAPTDDEIIAQTGIRAWELPLVRRVKLETTSLDHINDSYDETGETALYDVLVDARVDVEAEALQALEHEDLYATLRRTLTTRELLVLSYRYRLGTLSWPWTDTLGADDEMPMEQPCATQHADLMLLREIGARLGLDDRTVSEIEQTALAKLRRVYGAQTDAVLVALRQVA